jgi:hypothetical protein
LRSAPATCKFLGSRSRPAITISRSIAGRSVHHGDGLAFRYVRSTPRKMCTGPARDGRVLHIVDLMA